MVAPSVNLFKVTKTDCGVDVSDGEAEYDENELNTFHTSGCGDEQTSLGIVDSSAVVAINNGASQEFCFDFVPSTVGYYRCEINPNVQGADISLCPDLSAWCYVRVGHEEIPEFGGIASGFAIAGAGAGFLLLRKRK